MAGADDDKTVWAAQFAELLAGQAAEVLELVSLLAAGSQDRQAGDDEPWVGLAERLEALWRQFLQDRTEAFVEVWPDIARNLTNMLPLVSRGINPQNPSDLPAT